jgi:membrane-bound inhibitor of C-type lysozyme
MGTALLGACANVKDSRQNEVTFTCDGGDQITAWFEDGAVRVLLPGAEDKVRLAQVSARGGDRYESGGISFSVHNDSAMLERDGKPLYYQCAP